MRFAPSLSMLALAATLAGCGTTYKLPEVDTGSDAAAARMFAAAKAAPARKVASVPTAEARFQRVTARVTPAARQLCETELSQNRRGDCALRMELDREMRERNAYFTYVEGRPTIRFSIPLLQDVQSDDEVAFILGHEYGHLIGQHLQKQQQQAVAGALILGVLTAAANANAAANGGYYDRTALDRNMTAGAALGQRAYSQGYELESDMLGTRIAAAAGYDPVEGAKFFARDEAARSQAGKLSFWGTHPADEDRLAMVLATKSQIDTQQSLARKNRGQ